MILLKSNNNKYSYFISIKLQGYHIAYSSILHLQDVMKGIANPHIAAWYGLDATCSGLQMLSILFRSKSLSSLCNLMGTETKDIYSLARDNLELDLSDLALSFNFYNEKFDLNNYHLNKVLLEFQKCMNKDTTFQLQKVLNLCKSFCSDLQKLDVRTLIEGRENELFNTYATKIEKELYTMLEKDHTQFIPHYKLLVILNIQFKLYKMYHSVYDSNYLTKIRELTEEELKQFLSPEALGMKLELFKDFIK